VRKKLLNAVRAGELSNVAIRRVAAELQIVRTPADEVRLMPVIAQGRADLFGQFVRCHAGMMPKSKR
jgi:hypothetical protein